MNSFSLPAQLSGPLGLRIRLRDTAVWLFAVLPIKLRLWLYDRFLRPLLWFFFHLESRPIVVASAGPSGNRFKMWLSWQSHIVYTLGIYEPQIICLLRAAVKPGDFCIDVGAHLGYLTLVLSRMVGHSGRVVSFEPVPENFRALQENIRLNKATNVDLHNTAISDSSGAISIACVAQQTFSWTPSAVSQNSADNLNTIICNSVTLDDFLAGTPRIPRLIKIDVEGAELLVLRGAIRILETCGPILYLEIHNWGSPASAEVLRFLEERGYFSEIVGTRGQEAFCLAVPLAKQALVREIRAAARA